MAPPARVPDTTLTVNTVSELRNIHVSQRDDGSTCWVRDLLAPYTLIKNSGVAPSGLEIVAPRSGSPSAGNLNARWFRGASTSGSTSWGEQGTWYIDGDDGNDENNGATPLTPLLTLNEFARRVRGVELVSDTIIVMSGTSVLGNTLLNIDVNGTLTIQGVKVEEREGTLTDVQVWDPSGPDTGWIEDTAFANWNDSLGRQIELTAGPNAGSKAWVVEDIGLQRALFSPFANFSLFDNVNPQVGNGYTVYSLPIISGELVINVDRGVVVFRDLAIDTPGAFDLDTRVNSGLVEFYDCIIGGIATLGSSVLSGSFEELWNCRVASGLLTFQSGQIFLDGGLYETRVRVATGSTCEVGLQTLFFGPASRLEVQYGAWTRVVFAGYWIAFEGDSTVPVVVEGAVAANASIWGNAAAAAPAAFRVRNGGRIDYNPTEPPAILGTIANMIIGGDVTTYGALPFFNTDNGCAVVEITV